MFTQLSRRSVVLVVSLFTAAITLSIVGATVNGQDSKNETWMGTLDVGVAKLRIQLNLTADEKGKFTGEMVSIDQSSQGIAMDEVVRSADKLSFKIKRLGVSFSGKINPDASEVTGKFTQGREFDMVFKRVEKKVTPDKPLQTWKGTMDAGGKKFDFQFRIVEDFEGKERVKLDSFSEGITGIPAELEKDGDQITITIPMTKAKFVGTLSKDEETIDGSWLQRGGKFPLKLASVPVSETRGEKLNRPQTPKAPFNYNVSEFSVAVNTINSKYSNDVVLAGTLTSPKGAGDFPTVILISGSGPQDRDETIFQHKPFMVMADHLTKNGFAVIRFDERGIGESKGTFAGSTSADFADDVEALVGWAAKQPQVNKDKIVLAGHSEGGLIAPMVASRNKGVAGVIMLAGPGVSGSEIILNQSRKIAAVSGVPEQVQDMQEKMFRKLFKHFDDGGDINDELKDSLDAEFSELTEKQRVEYQINDVGEKTLATMNSPWMRYFLNYDPAPALAKTSVPILSVIGSNDLQVDPELNLGAIEEAVKAGENPDFVQKELAGLNHLFQKSETGSPSEYVTIEQTLDQSLLDEVTNWLEGRFK